MYDVSNGALLYEVIEHIKLEGDKIYVCTKSLIDVRNPSLGFKYAPRLDVVIEVCGR